LLSSTDELAIADAIAALELHMQQLEDEAQGGDGYSLVGMRFNAQADEHRAARSSFGESAAVYVEDVTEAEIHVTRHMEQDARVRAQRIFGDSFRGFNHLEGGVADVLMDSDVVAARFRFDELVAPFVSTTEERFDVSGMAEIVERELHRQPDRDPVALERPALAMLLPRLRERLELLRSYEPTHWLDNADTADADQARRLCEELADVMSPLELRSCDPREDVPSLWEAFMLPDRVKYRIRMRVDTMRVRARQRASTLAHDEAVQASHHHAWAWDGEPSAHELAAYDTLAETDIIDHQGVAA
jgi:hypothetical protein